jgi:hypothetical protein
MRHLITAGLLACALSAHGADALPPYLTGTWGTAASLHEGTEKQANIYLLPDGFGALAGSTSAPRRADGVDDGKPAPRGIVGLPILATLDGDTLTARLFLPDTLSAAEVKGAASIRIICRYQQAGPVMTCTGLDGAPTVMKRHSDTTPPDLISLRDSMRH